MPDTVLSVGNIKMDTVLSTGKMDTLKEHQYSVVKSGMATGEIRNGYRGIPQEHPPTWGWEVGGASSGSEL